MNQQIFKFIKSGIIAGLIAAAIEIIIAAVMTKYFGQNIDPLALALGGATIGLITLVLTVIISAVIARSKQRG